MGTRRSLGGSVAVDQITRHRRRGLITAIAGAVAANAHAQPSAQGFIDAWQSQALQIGAASAGVAQARCDALASSLIDIPTMAVSAASQARLALTPARQARLVAQVRSFVDRNCVARRAQSAGSSLQLLGVRPAAGGQMTITAAASGPRGASHRVAWRVAPTAGGYRALDVMVDGVSLTAQISATLERLTAQFGDADAAIQALGRG